MCLQDIKSDLFSAFAFLLLFLVVTLHKHWLTNVLTADIYLVDHRAVVDVCANYSRINLTLDVLLLLSPKDLPHFSQRGWQQNQQSHYFINIMHKLNLCWININRWWNSNRLRHDHSGIVVICTCVASGRLSSDLLNQLQ